MQALKSYAAELAAADSRLMIVTEDPEMLDQLARLGVTDVVGRDGIYVGDHRVGNAVATAVADAEAWIADEGNSY